MMFTYGLGRRDVGRAITAAVDEVLAEGLATADQVLGRPRLRHLGGRPGGLRQRSPHHATGGAEFERNPFREVAARG